MRYLTVFEYIGINKFCFELHSNTCPSIADLNSFLKSYLMDETAEILADEYEFDEIVSGTRRIWQGSLQTGWNRIIGKITIFWRNKDN